RAHSSEAGRDKPARPVYIRRWRFGGSDSMRTSTRIFGAVAMGAVLAACGERPAVEEGVAPPAPQRQATESDSTASKDFGTHVVHFNALRTSDLTPEVAKNFNIVRSPNQVMLNVSVTRKSETGL